jgi:putative transposase
MFAQIQFGVNNMKSHHHCVYNLKYHLVLVTKYRRKCFTNAMLERLEVICREQCQHWSIALDEFGGEADHVHLLIDMHPNIMPSRFINSLKTVTSRLLRKEFSVELSRFYRKPGVWTRAYCLITAGGAPLSILSEYIQNQERPEQ